MLEIPVFFSTDHNYIVPTCVAILSMLRTSTDCFCRIYILIDDTIQDSDKEILNKTVDSFSADITYILIGSELNNAYAFRGISKAAYYRLLIPWLMPTIEKAVYCDGDIIFTRSVSQLFEHSLDSYLLAGVHTPFYDSKSFAKYCLDLNLNPQEYINSGILLINCTMMREMGMKDNFMSHIGEKYYYQDQDIINIVCQGRIKKIPLTYNYPSYLFHAIEGIPHIIHFSGPKPWKGFTNLWAYWWSIYSESAVYDSNFENDIYQRILIPDYSLKTVFRLFCRHIKNKLS